MKQRKIDIQRALVLMKARYSYEDAGSLIAQGKVILKGRVIDKPWWRLKAGYYTVVISDEAIYQFEVRDGGVQNVSVKKLAG